MLFRPTRLPWLKLLLRATLATLATLRSRRPRDNAADLAYLARLSDERLERDLGLLRHGRDYRPY
jgi:hypothetical protein